MKQSQRRTGAKRRRIAAWCRHGAVLAALLMATPVVAQPTQQLSDAWVSVLGGVPGAISWGHAVATRRATLESLPVQQARLRAELDTLVASARLSGNGALSQGLAAWRQAIADADLTRSRTPGRHDLPWIAADLRRDLPLTAVASFALCEPPRWVEVWHLGGITRVRWQSQMTLAGALSTLPDNATTKINRAAVISPLGELQMRGIADWNNEATGLAPGARVVLLLPEAQGLRAALPFPGTVEEAGWVNQALPEFLATRLPGEECQLWDVE
ncbi:hypothetical protein [Halomonas sp. H10-9-1]|uniref:hypothetical protein n=1 Tax=Halomonas sp. H10-9-1 TaxID=2950871 RepID=UPI0032DED689